MSTSLNVPQVFALYVKLGALFVKQISKPLANQMKKTAASSPILRPRVIRLGTMMHEWSVALTNRLKDENSGTNHTRSFAGKLDDDVLLKKATDFLGEIFIFSVAGVAVLYEVKLSAAKEKAKSEHAAAEKAELHRVICDLAAAVNSTASFNRESPLRPSRPIASSALLHLPPSTETV